MIDSEAFGRSDHRNTINSQGEVFRLIQDPNSCLDVKDAKFEKGQEVLSYHAHLHGNQWFVVNSDNTISCTHIPNLKLGLSKNNTLCLVEEKAKEVLVFKDMTPTLENDMPTLPLVMSQPVDGKTIMFNGSSKQWGHGMEQYIKVGSKPETALKVFFDD